MPRKQLNIGVRPEDYELVLAAAEEAGQDVTGFCRAAILRAAAPQPVEPQPAASIGSVVLPAAFFWTLAQPYIEAYQQAQEPAALGGVSGSAGSQGNASGIPSWPRRAPWLRGYTMAGQRHRRRLSRELYHDDSEVPRSQPPPPDPGTERTGGRRRAPGFRERLGRRRPGREGHRRTARVEPPRSRRALRCGDHHCPGGRR